MSISFWQKFDKQTDAKVASATQSFRRRAHTEASQGFAQVDRIVGIVPTTPPLLNIPAWYCSSG